LFIINIVTIINYDLYKKLIGIAQNKIAFADHAKWYRMNEFVSANSAWVIAEAERSKTGNHETDRNATESNRQ
jgi:hypothetical protein